MTQSFELLSCERVEMKYSRFFENFQHFSFDHIGKKKEEGRVLGAERLGEQVAHLSIWYFKNFNANWSQIRMRNWNHIWCAKCCRCVLPHKLRSNQVEKFYIYYGFTHQKHQYSNRQDWGAILDIEKWSFCSKLYYLGGKDRGASLEELWWWIYSFNCEGETFG